MWCRSKKLRICALEPSSMANTCSCDHVSIRTERTKDVWTPYERCLPLQCMQIKMPYVTLAHSGLASPQSQHRPLPGSDTKRRRQLRGNLAPSCGHTERILSSSAAAWATIAGAACSILVWWKLCVVQLRQRMGRSTKSQQENLGLW